MNASYRIAGFTVLLMASTIVFAQAGTYKTSKAPSGNEQTDVTLSRNQNNRVTQVHQPGADAGTVNGNSVNFDTTGAVGKGESLDNTRVNIDRTKENPKDY